MNSIKDMWAMVLEDLKNSLDSPVIYNVWFAPIEIVSFDGIKVELAASAFMKKIIEQQFMPKLYESFKNVLGFDVQIVFVDPVSVSESENEKTEEKSIEEINTFETFVVGSSNNFAYSAAKAVAENPVVTYNPLFIYGSSGLGKTHLLSAIRHEIQKSHPETTVIMTRGEDFVNLIVESINNQTMNRVHEKFRNCDVLLVDDIQFIANKTATQEEFFHTFNALADEKKQIVLTSDRPPKEIEDLAERLRSRFESGLTADIQAPDFETRMAIVNRKAAVLGLDIPGDVVEFIADKIKNNVRQLEGAVKKIHALVTIERSSINIAMAQSAIKDMAGNSLPVDVLIEKLIAESARTYGVTPADIVSSKRDQKTARARQVAIYTVRKCTDLTQNEISNYFGGRDRTAILYSINLIGDEIELDRGLKRTVENIIRNAQEQ
ncbi:MAG: chromosomal replication initiator protein DnaA [Clostridiales bacterium]|nr:chromosomal replication initiator protein DnaA [Clostridiales bacterium]